MSDEAHIEPLLIDYAAGTLTPDARSRVEAHLAGCAPCRRALDEWRKIAAAARENAAAQPRLPALDWRMIRGEHPMTALPKPKTAGPQPKAVHFSPRRFGLPLTLTALLISSAFLLALLIRLPENEPPSAVALQNETATESPTKTSRPPTGTPPPTRLAPTTTPPPTATPLKLGYMPVLVAARSIESGAVIRPEDLTVYAIFGYSQQMLMPEDVLYRIARVNLICGQILDVNMTVGNAREVIPAQPAPPESDCSGIEQTYTPGGGNYLIDYSIALRDDLFAYTMPIKFARDLDTGAFVGPEDILTYGDGIPQMYPDELVMPQVAIDFLQVVGRILPAPVVRGQLALAATTPSTMETISVTLPRELVEVPESLAVGAEIDIIASLVVVETGSDSAPGLTEERVVRGAFFRFAGTSTVIVSVRLDDKETLDFLKARSVPLRLEPVLQLTP